MQGYNPYGDPMAPEARLSELTPEQRAQYDSWSPAAQQAFLAALMKDYGAEIDSADTAISRAEALRYNPQAAGRRAGGMYVAAHPLEHIADVARHYKGTQDLKTAQAARQKALDESNRLRQQLGERLFNRSDAIRNFVVNRDG